MHRMMGPVENLKESGGQKTRQNEIFYEFVWPRLLKITSLDKKKSHSILVKHQNDGGKVSLGIIFFLL